MEEGDNSSFEFGAPTGIDSSRWEGLPDNGLADVGGDEKGDTGTETISLLKKLVEKNNNERCRDELNDQKKADTSAKIARLTVETCKDVDGCLTKGNNQSKDYEQTKRSVLEETMLGYALTFLCSAEKSSIFLQGEIDLDEICTGKKLHDHPAGNDWGDTEFHECSSIWSEDNTHPVERVWRVRGHDTVEGHLRANQEYEESYSSP